MQKSEGETEERFEKGNSTFRIGVSKLKTAAGRISLLMKLTFSGQRRQFCRVADSMFRRLKEMAENQFGGNRRDGRGARAFIPCGFVEQPRRFGEGSQPERHSGRLMGQKVEFAESIVLR